MSTIDVYSLTRTETVDLFEIDLTEIGGAGVLRFTNAKKENGSDISWSGNSYTSYPIQASGFRRKSVGAPARPQVSGSNAFGLITQLITTPPGLNNAKVRRVRVSEDDLDDAPRPDPTAVFLDEIWFISNTSDSSNTGTLFLMHPLQTKGEVIPRRVLGDVMNG